MVISVNAVFVYKPLSALTGIMGMGTGSESLEEEPS